jgi:hypothetical protein
MMPEKITTPPPRGDCLSLAQSKTSRRAESYPVYDNWWELIEHIRAAVDQALESGRIDEPSHRKICDRLEAENCNHALSR